MSTNRLLVFNASAGSGKTFQIAKHYLNHLLQSQAPHQINRLIGITFTNKAAEEMKKRIIQNLIRASEGQIDDVMAAVIEESEAVIKKQIGINEDVDYQEEIIKRSRQRLTEILHYYDEFQLTTIDKLMYKIIKTFAREMHLSSDVEVEMGYKEVVKNLIDQLINRAEPGSLLSKFLIDFAINKVEEDKFWDIKEDLAKINDIIFDDNYFEALKSLKDKKLKDFVALNRFLNAEIKKIDQELKTMGLALEQAFGSYKNHINISVVSLTNKLIFDLNKVEIVDAIRKKHEASEPVYYVKSHLKSLTAEEKTTIMGVVNDDIHQLLSKIIPFVDQKIEQYRFYKALRQEVNALSIENELQKDIELFKETQNKIFISDFNKLILEQILRDLASDTPYIYMRLGEKYAHYFVDEFQDTSELQWQNLIPLIREALSKEFEPGKQGDAMIVGDAKQSIYRFRGGKPEQFIALSNPEETSGDGNPFAPLTRKKVANLAFNWRSKAHVIKFNNLFFREFPKYLSSDYQRVYENVAQDIPPGKKLDEGYVQINFLNRQDRKAGIEKESFAEFITELIPQIEQKGFQKEDICILINNNNDSKKIAEVLNQNGIEVVSSESLLVAGAGKVRFLLSWLAFINTGNAFDLYDAVRFLTERDRMSKESLYETVLTGKDLSGQQRTALFNKIGYHVDYQQIINFNLYDLLVYLIEAFKLNADSSEQAYLQAFLEKVFQLTESKALTIRDFLKEWEDIAPKFSIDVPDKKGAVKIMTVHKSKGLEFPVVIYYTDEAILSSRDLKNKVWVPVDSNQYKGFELLPINLGAIQDSANETYREIYQKAAGEKSFDNLNRVYVAMTRAVEQLYVVLNQPGKNPKNTGVNQMFLNFLNTNFPQADDQKFSYGQPEPCQVSEIKSDDDTYLNRLFYRSWRNRHKESFLKINTLNYERWAAHKKQAVVYGLQLHDILSKIETYDQWLLHKNKFIAHLPEEDQSKIQSIILSVLQHPDLKSYYTKSYEILNERSILIPQEAGFVQKRPDRLLIKNNKITIIDYKTGEKIPKHAKQLNDYADLLQNIGFEVDKKLLVYITGEQAEVLKV